MQLGQPKKHDAILLMAYGGPSSLDDVAGFLSDIRKGRPLSAAFLSEVIERYRLIGGFSPLREICERLVNKLSLEMGQPVYLGMRHWHPFIRETILKIAADGHRSVLGICLAPHYSGMSIHEYQKAVLAANAELPQPMEIQFVDSWALQPAFISFHVREILLAKEELGLQDWSDTQIMLTAHSLPSRILQNQDPYVDQLNQTVQAIQEGLGIDSSTAKLVFQSASPTPEPWLSPVVEEELGTAAASGIKNIIVAPIGFVAEHVEVLYDLDIVAKERADKLGLRFKRTAMLNDRPQMLAILHHIIEESASSVKELMVDQQTERYFA